MGFQVFRLKNPKPNSPASISGSMGVAFPRSVNSLSANQDDQLDLRSLQVLFKGKGVSVLGSPTGKQGLREVT